MKIGPLSVEFHRTVRVADGRTPSNLPPSLGRAKVTPVAEYKDRWPESWEESGHFIPLHDREALWLSFSGGPVAVVVGAGGINAISGQKLGTTLEKNGYVVTPPQPWLDGWKGEDGVVYQFVATPFQAGDGLSVGEQILGSESKSGGIGIAVFESKEPLKAKPTPPQTYGMGAYETLSYKATSKSAVMSMAASPTRSMRGAEMGVGKGGRIIQKIYPDPYGIDVWRETPVAAAAIYLISAEDYKTITGVEVPPPTGHETYEGGWFGLGDEAEKDVPAAPVFSGLKTVFSGDVSNVQTEELASDAE